MHIKMMRNYALFLGYFAFGGILAHEKASVIVEAPLAGDRNTFKAFVHELAIMTDPSSPIATRTNAATNLKRLYGLLKNEVFRSHAITLLNKYGLTLKNLASVSSKGILS